MELGKARERGRLTGYSRVQSPDSGVKTSCTCSHRNDVRLDGCIGCLLRLAALLVAGSLCALMTDRAQPAVSESAGRLCSACSERKQKPDFSGRQWTEPAASRRCTACIHNNVSTTKQPPAKAPTPSPPTASSTVRAASASSVSVPASSVPGAKGTAAAGSAPAPPTPINPLSSLPPSARVTPKSRSKLKRPAVLTADGDWFVPEAEAALSEIFDRFDLDRDGQWNIKETQAFAVATNGKPFTTESARLSLAGQTQAAALR